MKAFLDLNFLLQNEAAKTLYHEHAAKMPIIDYHCHINPSEIANDRHFTTITEAWLGGDHYKWRIMRANGVEEEKITGAASDWEKFAAFADTLPKAAGNPLYHWTHLELQRFFDCDAVLGPQTAKEIWRHCNETLKTLSVCEMIRKSNVEVIVSTDDPADSLAFHKQIKEEGSCTAKVLPGWRPDKAVNLSKPGFREYIKKLSEASGVEIRSMGDVKEALARRLDHFDAMGCRVSDHGLDTVPFAPGREKEAGAAFLAVMEGGTASPEDTEAYQYELMHFLGTEYEKRGWVLQFHYGAVRNANARMFGLLGPDTGYDCIGPGGNSEKIAGFLDSLEKAASLPKTILYSLNPGDNAMLDSIIGCFQGGVPGKIQHGSAWWFNDTKLGMTEQLTSLANMSVLGNFVGMLTDSRSFLSYPRHEYFRRILCSLLGSWVENGELPCDLIMLGALAEDISYRNAKRYFGF